MIDRTAALATLMILAAQISVNIGAAIGKSLFPAIGPEGVAALRTIITTLILLPLARPWRVPPTRAQAGWLLLYGLALGGMNILIYRAFAHIPIGLAVAIEISGPMMVVLLASRTWRDLLWLGIAVAGLVLLVPWPGAETRIDPAGVGYALGAALCWALYIVFGKRASQVGSGSAVALGMLAACLVTVPLGVAAGGARLLLPPVLALGLVVALLSSTLPYMLEMTALGRVSSRVFGTVMSSAPAVAALAGFFILGERLSGQQWLAIGLMMTASAGCSLAVRPKARPAFADVAG